MSVQTQESGIHIVEVRVRNFRSIKSVNVLLDPLTVLIGENNSGKTTFLEAIFVAIGAGRRFMSDEDVFLASSESRIPRDRVTTIDILVRPTDYEGNIIDSFPPGSYWTYLWGPAISQDEDDAEFLAIRTQMKWSTLRAEYITERRFLREWPADPERMEQARVKENDGHISSAHVEPFAFYLMDAKRDMQDDLQSRSSFWYKLVSDPGLTEPQVEELEKTLSSLNEQIISNSEVLTHVQTHLNDLYLAGVCEKDGAAVTPMSRNFRDLSRGIGVNFATVGAQAFPLVKHGMGTRSLAALLTFRAFTTWRQKNAKENEVHPMLGLEEPESHLHPQAQRALFKLIEQIPGQRIVSTHSPYIVSQAQIVNLRHFRKEGANTVVSQMDTRSLSAEDIRKIDRMVIQTRGDILYARALVFFEGETEEQAFPVFAERYWGRHINELGISFVGVSGAGNYLPFLRLATSFSIPWYLFSDGEAPTVQKVRKDLAAVGHPDPCPNLFIIPDGQNFEQYIVTACNKEALINMIVNINSQNDLHAEALHREWTGKADPLNDLFQEMTSNKTNQGLAAAEAGAAQVGVAAIVRTLLERERLRLGDRE